MNTGVISRRYAKALLKLTEQTGHGELVCQQALQLLENNKDSPQDLAEELGRLTALLLKNGRLPYLRFILRSYVDMYRKANGITAVTLTLAQLPAGGEDELIDALSREFGGKLLVKTIVDPYLIGGFVLQIDDRILDASARRSIEIIRQRLDQLNKRIV